MVGALAAAAPALIATARALNDDWYPYGDRGVIAVRAFEVFSLHSPLLGQFSALSSAAGRPLFSPGPLLYWLLAIPARLGALWFPLWMGAFNAAVITATVALARRRGGIPLMLATALGIAVSCRSLPSGALHDIWNPYASLMPFLLLLLLAWSIAAGEHRWLTPAVILASFLVESHLTFGLPAIGALAVAAAGCWGDRHAALLRRRVRVAVVAAIACWIAPIVQTLTHPPGNLVGIARALARHHPSLGAGAGWHAVVHAVGMPAWWVRAPVVGFKRLIEVVGTPPASGVVGAAVVLLALGVMLAIGLRRGRADLAAASALALLGCLALGLATASTPTEQLLGLTIGYTIWWSSLLGLFAWLVLGWGLVVLLAPVAGGRLPVMPGRLRQALPAAGALAVLGAGLVLGLGAPRDGDRGEYRPFARLAARLTAALPPAGTVLVSADPRIEAYELQTAAVYALLHAGHEVIVPAGEGTQLGGAVSAGHRRYVAEVAIGFDHVPPGGRLLAQVAAGAPAPVHGTWAVVLRPGSPAIRARRPPAGPGAARGARAAPPVDPPAGRLG